MDNRNYDGILWYKNYGYWSNGKYGSQHVYVYEKLTGCKVFKHQVIHHLDGDPSNNTAENLVCMTRSDHQYLHHYGKKKREEALRCSNASGYKGVCFNGKKWYATIRDGLKKEYLGCYITPEDAARAYDAKARELWGDEAFLNFP